MLLHATVRCLFLTISQHVSGIIMPIFRRTRRSCSPEDGHNDAGNMLRNC